MEILSQTETQIDRSLDVSRTRRNSASPRSFGRHHRNGLLCALLVGFCIFAINPTLEMGTNDDWSYALTSLDLARTGHVVYNGWTTAMLGWQVFWGALVIKLFGFSFLALRLSTLPFAMGSAYLLHQILIRFGLNARHAVLGTLTIVLSPVFLPVTASFMTDVPGFFWILVCLYSCLRALDEKHSRAAILWLSSATLGSVVGGTGRQIVWLGALVMMPSTAWLLRKRQGVLASTIVLWFGSIVMLLACMYWFQHQPYSIPEKFLNGNLTWAIVPALLQQIRNSFLTVLLLILPVLAAFLTVIPIISKRLFFSLLVSAILLIAVRAHGDHALALAPWLPNMITEYGVLGSGVLENLGVKPLVLSFPVRLVVTFAVLTAACACGAAMLGRRRRLQNGPVTNEGPSWAVILILLTPFTIAYLLLLLPRAAFVVTVDRYLIPLVAVCLIALLRYYQERIRARPPALSFAVLACFCLYGVASTHDYFATNRARLAAASAIRATGVPRVEIQGGWEYDAWTQIETAGFINDPRLEIPPGAYHKVRFPGTLPQQCRFWFNSFTPAVMPRYFVVFSPQSCLAPSNFMPVSYHAWLPPFQRQIYIQQQLHSR